MSAQIRVQLWATANGVDIASVTATFDGERIVEINGNQEYAAQAMAIPQGEIDAAATAERVAIESAAALLPQDVDIGKAKCRSYPDGSLELISGPLILPGTDAGAFEVWVDSDTGLVLTVLDHASPRKSKAEKDAAKADRRAKIAAVKAAKNDNEKLTALLVLMGLTK